MSIPLILSIIAVATFFYTPTQTEISSYRLPLEVLPQNYTLRLLTDLDDFLFKGVVEIQIKCEKATTKITLHSSGLNIEDKDVSLKQLHDNVTVPIIALEFDTDYDFLVIVVGEKLKSGSLYLLHIPFGANLSTSLTGYYRTSYKDNATNTTKWLAITQFQPIEARRVFPCFDEPDKKATFAISLGHKPHLTAVSNMPISSSNEIDGWTWDDFEVTLPMSTYLIAFMVSDLESKESYQEPNMVKFKTWTRKDAIDQVDFSLIYGPKFLSYFEEFFNIKYPLPKQDLVALQDMQMAAMENWGLITFRESMLLVDEHITSNDEKRLVAVSLAHELAHQWFGNLVTLDWWNGLWLNEGFATYVSDLATQQLFPEWNNFNFSIASNFLAVFKKDALKSSHPVLVPVTNPKFLFQIFDIISYRKGSMLLYMINSFLGDDVFRAGLNTYLNKFKYSNTEQDDLWAALTESADGKDLLPSSSVTVKHIMDSWTLQAGYPVLSVRRNGGKVNVTQKRFYAVSSKDEDDKNCWWIPITFSTAKKPQFNETRSSHWLDCGLLELSIDTGAGPDDWIVLNNRGSGIYRVNYDTHSWNLLIEALYGSDMMKIDDLNRMLIVADAMALAQTGDLDYSLAFRILKYVKLETALYPWQAVSADLKYIETLLQRTDKYKDFKRLISHLMSDTYKRFGDLTYAPENLEEMLLKELVVSWACKYQVGNCSDNAVQLFKAWMTSDTNQIPSMLRSTVYCQGVKQGDETEWIFVWHKYEQSNIATDKSIFLNSLSCTQNESLLSRILELSLDNSSGIQHQDAYSVFSSVASSSPLGYELALRFLEDNIQRLYNFFAPETHTLGGYVGSLTFQMVYEDELDKIKEFLKKNEKLFVKSQMTINQSLEQAENNILWMKAFYANISSAFEV